MRRTPTLVLLVLGLLCLSGCNAGFSIMRALYATCDEINDYHTQVYDEESAGYVYNNKVKPLKDKIDVLKDRAEKFWAAKEGTKDVQDWIKEQKPELKAKLVRLEKESQRLDKIRTKLTPKGEDVKKACPNLTAMLEFDVKELYKACVGPEDTSKPQQQPSGTQPGGTQPGGGGKPGPPK